MATTDLATRDQLRPVWHAHLQTELTAIRALSLLLERQKQVLSEAPGTESPIMASAQDVTACADQLVMLESVRHDLIRQSGFLGDPKDMRGYDAWLGRPAPGLLEELLLLSRECRRLNIVIGAAIAMRQQQVSRGLTLLRGEVANAVCEASGRVLSSGTSRPLTRA